jgi:2-(1,2-epoxy-1,2-dihydrophenyl)acetyl-CoA isomerase
MIDSILLEIEDGLARVTLNRPDRLNALDGEMAERWRDVTRRVAADPAVGAVLLDATGPAFCAGGDVVAMATAGIDGAALTDLARVINDGILAFAESDKPVAAAVQGTVAGGGVGIMLAADYIVASPVARFVSRYANMGLTPDLGATTLVPAAVGQHRALQLFLQDRVLSAEEACEWGLVAEVADDPGARAREVAESWLSGATGAFGQAKRLVRQGAHRAFTTNLDDEAATIGRALDTEDARARVTAFATASARSTGKSA